MERSFGTVRRAIYDPGEMANPDGYPPTLVARQYGNENRLVHGLKSARHFPLSAEEEAEVEALRGV